MDFIKLISIENTNNWTNKIKGIYKNSVNRMPMQLAISQ